MPEVLNVNIYYNDALIDNDCFNGKKESAKKDSKHNANCQVSAELMEFYELDLNWVEFYCTSTFRNSKTVFQQLFSFGSTWNGVRVKPKMASK